MIVPHNPRTRQLSPEARALSQRIDTLIREYRVSNPRATDLEVLQALELVRQEHQVTGGGMRGDVAGMVAGGLVAAGIAAFVAMSLRSEEGVPATWMFAGVAVVVAMVVVAILVARRG